MPKEAFYTLIIVMAVLWTLPWKGVALWKAAQAKNRIWFVVLLIFNSLAILEIFYIFIFSKKKSTEKNEALEPVKISKIV